MSEEVSQSEKTIELLAILGRGIQKVGKDGVWEATEDLEICDENGAHLAVRLPADDEHPHCLIGGGELNLHAGAVLARLHASTLKAVVCAYAPRPPYLAEVDGPNESEVMSEQLKTLLDKEVASSNLNHYTH